MIQLTQRDVLAMTKQERKEQLNYFQDLACNIDYTVNQLESDTIQRNINLLESKILHNEF